MKLLRTLAFIALCWNTGHANVATNPSAQSAPAFEGLIEDWQAIALTVWDGNTIDVSRDNKVYKVLLSNVKAPVRGQPFHKEARQALKEMIYGQKIHVFVLKQTTSGLLFAQVKIGDLNVSSEMVKRGLAWVHRQYNSDPALVTLEDNARKEKLGLWQADKPLEPWEFRKQQRALNNATTDKNTAAVQPTLQDKAVVDNKK